jgi:hypothetical protein
MIVPGKAGSYAQGEEGGFDLALANWEQTGDGAVNTTVEDLAKWDANFTTGIVGGPAGLKEMETVGVLNDGKAISYALGLSVDQYRGLRRVSHGGSWAGFRAHLLRFPDRHASVISLCNLASSNPGELNRRVGDLLLEGALAAATENGAFVARPSQPPTWTPTPSELAAVAGVYHSDELLADWRIYARGDSLFARAGLGGEFPLRPTGRDTFTAFGTRVTVLRTGDRVTGFTLDNRGLRRFALARIGDAP